MSNNKQKKTDYINWHEYQNKYFDAFKAFNPSADAFKAFNPSASFSDHSAGQSLFNNAMENWWKVMKGGASIDNTALFENILSQCKNYYFMGEHFSSLFEGLEKNKNKDVTSFINEKFKELELFLSYSPTDFSWGSIIDTYEVPYEWMKNNSSENNFNFFALFESINPELKKVRDRFLSMPGLGQHSIKQEKFQKLIKLSINFQENYSKYQTAKSHINHDGLELMRKKVLRMSKKGETFNSIQQIYNLWVESNEKVYAEYAHSQEYADLNGQLVNSQMALKKLSQELNEDMLSALNMPTTRALNELERRHYELRKKVKTMESEIKELKELKEVKEVKEVINRQTKVSKKLNTETKSAQSPNKRAKKKKVTRKKTAKKKVTKKKVVKRAAKPAKKKSGAVNNDVIEIKF